METKAYRKELLLLRRELRLFLESFWYGIAYRGDNVICNYCNFKASRFKTSGYSHSVLSELKIHGGGYRENNLCPKCNSTDRERLSRILIDNFAQLPRDSRMLIVAPERNLARYLASKGAGMSVTLCDLNPDRYMWAKKIEKQDITGFTYESNSYDLVVCNHVLEHVPDDRKAMEELLRILKPGGFAVLQIPYTNELPLTEEDTELVDEDQRIRRFGQKDHVRVYTPNDYEDRLKKVGFESRIQTTDVLKSFLRSGINPSELGLLFRKPSLN